MIVSCILIWQFTTRGLRPAEQEQLRLERVAPSVEQRFEERRAGFEVMAAEADAWTDPVFQERQRRLRAAARALPVTLPAGAGAAGAAGELEADYPAGR